MAFDDIGYMLFVQVLGMTEYPGQPFTGIIVRDLILFFLVPTIFIIFVVYILLGRLAVEAKKIRLLLGLGIYLFILAGGYYRAFALLAGPYFVVLIFVLGILYFIPTHFRVQRGGGMPGHAAGGRHYESEDEERATSQFPRWVLSALNADQELDPYKRKKLKEKLEDLEGRREKILSYGPPERESKIRLDDIQLQIQAIERRLAKR